MNLIDRSKFNTDRLKEKYIERYDVCYFCDIPNKKI